MGAIWSLKLREYSLVESKYPIDALFLTLFRECDRVGRNARYSIPVSTLIRRLELLGFDAAYSRREFQRGLERLQREREILTESPQPKYVAKDPVDTNYFLAVISFERWFAAMRKLLDGRTEKHDSIRGVTPRQAVINYILDQYLWDDDDILHGFPGANWYALLRAAAEAASPDDKYELEYRELIEGGYYRRRTKLVDDALTSIASQYADSGPTIVLTEGAFDRRVLEGSLNVLSPELAGFFGFMDFHGLDVPGGAGHLINQVKAFAGAGIKNRVVAVFDNDSAGRASLSALTKSPLPRNFATIPLPDTPFAARYPTSGPTGRRRVNINGKAASIELYLGRDVLRDSNGRLRAIRWSSYDRGARAFQGELVRKGEIQRRFDDKLRAALADTAGVNRNAWVELESVWSAIFDATSRIAKRAMRE